MTGAGDPDQDLVRETVDHLAINRLQARYADTVTRRAWAELAELFLPEATVHIDTVSREPFDLTGPDEVGRFIGGAVERFAFFEFVVLNSHVMLDVDGDPDTASARMFMCEQRLDGATGEWSTAYGLYRDRYRRVDRRWWFADRRYRSLARTGPEAAVLGPWTEWGGAAP